MYSSKISFFHASLAYAFRRWQRLVWTTAAIMFLLQTMMEEFDTTHSFLRVDALAVLSAPPLRAAPSPLRLLPPPSDAQIISDDPLIYTLPQLLSPDECQAYRDYVEHLEQTNSFNSTGRSMTRSNPPAVSLETSKLWPLPLLSLAAGIPSILRTIQNKNDIDNTVDILFQIVHAVLLPVGIAASLSIALVLAIPRLLQLQQQQQSSEVGPGGGTAATAAAASRRTSVALALNQPDDIAFVAPLVQRLVDVTGHDWKRWEAPVVTRYDPGAIFAKHGDASPILGSEWKDEGGQRVITCICYLNELETNAAAAAAANANANANANADESGIGGGGGGETYFDRLNVAVTPQPGKALIFFPADATTCRADDRTTHESLPPRDDEKWIVQLFGRVGPRVPWPLGLPDEFGTQVETTTTANE
jgi:hypothetical protein